MGFALTFLALAALPGACVSQVPRTSQSISITVSTTPPQIAPHIAPSETRTPLTTRTPTSTPTPTKGVILAYGIGGIPGVELYGYFRGGYLPRVVLYADGQILIRDGTWFSEAWMGDEQVCSLMARLTELVARASEGPLFNASPTPGPDQIGAGMPYFYLDLAGDPPIRHWYPLGWQSQLAEEQLQPMDALTSFLADLPTVPYHADSVALWIESFEGWDGDGHFTVWPYDYPATLIQILSESPSHLVVVEGEQAGQLLSEIGDVPTIVLAQGRLADSPKYVVISRPLLPHESLFTIATHRYGDADVMPSDDRLQHCLE